jgi:hypothetical protein
MCDSACSAQPAILRFLATSALLRPLLYTLHALSAVSRHDALSAHHGASLVLVESFLQDEDEDFVESEVSSSESIDDDDDAEMIDEDGELSRR